MLTPLHSVRAITSAVQHQKSSASDVVDFYLKRIRALDPALGCFLLVNEEDVKQQAVAVDQRIRQGEGSAMPLAGVPVGIKDAIVTKGLRTTAGSKMLADFIPPYDATVIARLKQAGAIILGKTNMDEFAMGSSNENSAFKPCHNPWDVSRVPGGSSGGSAAAVAAGLCPVTLGSDTGGSIRQPAALCGISGLKPTYGRVSRLGLIAFGSSLDQIGPMGRSVEDIASILQAIAGADSGDATSVQAPLPDFMKSLEKIDSVRGLRIGIPSEYFQQGLDPEVEKHVRAALTMFERQGAQLVPISLPHSPHAVSVYYMIATAEAASNLSRFDGVRYGFRATLPPDASLAAMYERTRGEGFGPEVKRRIMLGTYVLRSGYVDAYYRRAGQVRTLIRRDFEQAFAQCDVIATPTSPVVAFQAGEHITDPLTMYLNDVYTIGCNLAGLPGLSIPCGFVETQGKKLPVGLQWIGPTLSEERLLQLGHLYQQWTSFHLASPMEGDLS